MGVAVARCLRRFGTSLIEENKGKLVKTVPLVILCLLIVAGYGSS